jgi:hypothetical protein
MDEHELRMWRLAIAVTAPGKWWLQFWACGWFGYLTHATRGRAVSRDAYNLSSLAVFVSMGESQGIDASLLRLR